MPFVGFGGVGKTLAKESEKLEAEEKAKLGREQFITLSYKKML